MAQRTFSDLSHFAHGIIREGHTLLLGLDHDNEPKLVELAYDDPAGHTRRFIMNGLTVLKRTLVESSAVTKESVEVFDPC
jgi:uncharacterized SAM-dependent methyltransferase